MNELVLALHVSELSKQNALPEGLCGFDLTEVDPHAYAMLPRHIADNKKDMLEQSLCLARVFPQILGYFQIVNPDGRILTYQRKGKEKGLLGKWSIGVGGHVSHDDFLCVADSNWEELPAFLDILFEGSKRELEEELGINADWLEQFNSPDDFAEAIKSIIHSWEDDTSKMHLGLPMRIELSEHMFDSLNLEPAEFLNYQWLTPDELKLSGLEFETWSTILIDNM